MNDEIAAGVEACVCMTAIEIPRMKYSRLWDWIIDEGRHGREDVG